MVFEHLIVSTRNKITTITINRPGVRNAINTATNLELDRCFDAFANDPESWIAIIQGAGGKAFSAGHDLKQQHAGDELVLPASGFGGLTSRQGLTKPIIAAVDGIAFGGGFELALACDIIVASEKSLFALPEPKVGLAALAGGPLRLARDIGLKQTMGIALTGRQVSAREGALLGFVNEVVADDALGCAERWAAQILTCSPMSVRATKDVILRSLTLDPATAAKESWEWPSCKAMFASADAMEGPRAFVERRAPVWIGS